MTIAAVCLATFCTIVGHENDPELHGFTTRMYLLEQTIHDKMAKALLYEKAIRYLLETHLKKLLDDHFEYAVNWKLQELEILRNKAEKEWRDRKYCYRKTLEAMKDAAALHFRESTNSCIKNYTRWVYQDLREDKALINNLADGLQQINNVIPDCQNNKKKPLVECMEDTISTIEENITKINDVSDLLLNQVTQSYINSVKKFEECLTTTGRILYRKAHKVYLDGIDCLKKDRPSECPDEN